MNVSNGTTSDKSELKNTNSDTKNKRQVGQFLRTPGASQATSIGTESEPQAFPLQLSHGIYSQQRVPLYTRFPTVLPKQQVTEDTDEQEPQQQQQVQKSILFPTIYNEHILDILNSNTYN